MIEFQYDGIASDGKPCQGTVRAQNVEAARLRLIGQGVTPVCIADGSTATAQVDPQARGSKLRRNARAATVGEQVFTGRISARSHFRKARHAR